MAKKWKAMALIVGIGLAAMAGPASAGHGNAVGAGLMGFGIGAIVGSAITPREVFHQRDVKRPTARTAA